MKNMFKKAICLVLALAMCASVVAFATETTEVTEEAAVDQTAIDETLSMISPRVLSAMEFLRGFGIIADYYETNVNVEEYITRADFVDALARLLNLSLRDRIDTYFYDVPPTHFANPAISSLTEMNIVNGVGDKCFEPDALIETAAACKVLLSVLGYDERANYEGGYPAGYIKVAKRLELLEPDYKDEYLKRGDMFILLLNAIKIPMFIPVSFSDTKGNLYQIDENQTILTQYYDAYYKEGTVEGANKMSINGSDLPETTYVEIDGVVYNSEVDLGDMIGEKVNFIARDAKGTEDATVFWAERSGITKTISVSAKQFAGFDAQKYELSYYNEKNEKAVKKLDRELALVYNGGLITNNISSVLNTPCDLKIVESQDGCVVIAKKKSAFVVNTVIANDELITNYITGGNPIDLNTDIREYVVIKDSAGKKISITDLVASDVLMVYESQYEAPATYGDYLELVVSKTVIEGKVEKIKDKDTGKFVTIAGKEYKDVSGLKYTLGSKITAYVDLDGDIVYHKSVSEKDFAGYVIAVGLEKGAFENQVFLRIFKQDGKFEIYEVAEKVVIDGVKKEREDLYGIVTDTDGKVEPQLALVKLDSDGKIAYFDTPALNDAYEGEGTLRPSTDPTGKNFMYKIDGYLMDYWNLESASEMKIGTHAYNSSTVIFRVPPKEDIKAGTTEDEQYGTGFGGYAKENEKINDRGGKVTGLYKTTSKRASVEEFITIEGYGKTNNTEYPLLVESTGIMIDDKGVPQDVIVGYDGSNLTSKVVREDVVFYNRVGQYLPTKTGNMVNRFSGAEKEGYTLADIKRGMLVEIETDKLGKVSSIAVVYDPEETPDKNYYKAMPNAAACEVGIVLDMDIAKGLMAFNVPRSDYDEATKNLVQVIMTSGAQVMIYDTEQTKNNIYAGTLADIRTTSNSPGNETTVLIYMNMTSLKRVYIFK